MSFVIENKYETKYFDELLERIKTIRVSERMAYQKVTDLLKFRRKEILNNSGSITHKEAVEKAEKEYEKFRVIQDQKYISSMDEFYNKYLSESKGDK